VGEVCFVRCSEGYLPAESMYVCAADGLFLGFEPTCKLVDCSNSVAAASDVSRDFSNCTGIVAGNDCTVACAYGYEGDASVFRCLPDGTLQGASPTCSRKLCAIPPLLDEPRFSLTTCSGAYHGDACLVDCNQGFSGVTEQFRCEDGVLQGTPPNCTGLACSLEGVQLGQGSDASDCVGKRALESCTLQCMHGYSMEPSGNSQMECKPDGSFTQHALTCLPKACGHLSDVPAFSSESIGHSCNGSVFGDVCSAFCKLGWELLGNASVLVCNAAPSSSAGFSAYFEANASYVFADAATGPKCSARLCTAGFPNMRGVKHNCTSTRTGEHCIVEADEGYTLSPATAALVCGPDGELSGDIFAVEPTACEGAILGPGVGSTCDGTLYGAECWAYCETGWAGAPRQYACRVNGTKLQLEALEEEIHCTSAALPRRVTATPAELCSEAAVQSAGLASPEFTHSCNNTMLGGDVCIVHCRQGWEMVEQEPTILRCENSSLVGGPLPQCLAKRCDFALPNGLGVGSNCSAAVTGMRCLATCVEGYLYSSGGPEAFFCAESGNFQGRAPDCSRRPCEDLRLAPEFQHNCRDKRFGDTCGVTCAPGFYLAGWGSQFQCNASGSFEGQLPLCLPSTCASNIPADAAFTSNCASVYTGQTCNFTCREGFEPNASALTCGALGNLIGQLPTCRPQRCSSNLDLQNKMYRHTCEDLALRETCSVVCGAGYDISGRGEQWKCELDDPGSASEPALSGTLPTCAPAACVSGYPQTTSHLKDNCTILVTGQTCQQRCAYGYVSDFPEKIFTCGSDGVVIPDYNFSLPCELVACRTDIGIPGVAHTCEGVLANGSCSAFCEAGFRLQGAIQIWTCAGPESGLPALGEDRRDDIALRGLPPVCVPETCAYNVPWEIQYEHNCSAVLTGLFCSVSCGFGYVGTSSLLQCSEDGALTGTLPSCQALEDGTTGTTTWTQTMTLVVVITINGKMTLEMNDVQALTNPDVLAGLATALAALLHVSSQAVVLAVQPIQDSADQSDVFFTSSSSEIPSGHLESLQRRTLIEVQEILNAELAGVVEEEIVIGMMSFTATVRVDNESTEVVLAPEDEAPESLANSSPLTTTVTASGSVLLCCCACAGCFYRQHLQRAAKQSAAVLLCAGVSKDDAAASDSVILSITDATIEEESTGEACTVGSASWDLDYEGVTRTLPPSREVTAGVASLMQSDSGGASGCPTRSPTAKDLREVADICENITAIMPDARAKASKREELEALALGVGFHEPDSLEEMLQDAGISLKEDVDDDAYVAELRLALEDVGVHCDEAVHLHVKSPTPGMDQLGREDSFLMV